MAHLMCRACGEFVRAVRREDDDTVRPLSARCPNCNGAEFKDTDTGALVRADD